MERVYNKRHFTEEGKFNTVALRNHKARADAYYSRGRTLLDKAKELHNVTGAHVLVKIIPSWEGGKMKLYRSESYPLLSNIRQPVVRSSAEANIPQLPALPTTPSPSKFVNVPEQMDVEPQIGDIFSPPQDLEEAVLVEAAQSAEVAVPSVSSAPSKAKSYNCAKCNIQYGTEADETTDSLWVTCTKSTCGWWAHVKCLGFYYPNSTKGNRALGKWAKDRVFCPRHMLK